MDAPEALIGRRVTYHRQGARAQLGSVQGIAPKQVHGRTVYMVTNDDPEIGTEEVSADRIIGPALDGTPEGKGENGSAPRKTNAGHRGSDRVPSGRRVCAAPQRVPSRRAAGAGSGSRRDHGRNPAAHVERGHPGGQAEATPEQPLFDIDI